MERTSAQKGSVRQICVGCPTIPSGDLRLMRAIVAWERWVAIHLCLSLVIFDTTRADGEERLARVDIAIIPRDVKIRDDYS